VVEIQADDYCWARRAWIGASRATRRLGANHDEGIQALFWERKWDAIEN
jgi:hypothetical protein